MVDKLTTYTISRPRLKKVLGWLFVVVGFILLVAPIVPGAPLLFIGLELLGLRFLFMDKVKRFFFRKQAPVTILVTSPVKEEVA